MTHISDNLGGHIDLDIAVNLNKEYLKIREYIAERMTPCSLPEWYLPNGALRSHRIQDIVYNIFTRKSPRAASPKSL